MIVDLYSIPNSHRLVYHQMAWFRMRVVEEVPVPHCHQGKAFTVLATTDDKILNILI